MNERHDERLVAPADDALAKVADVDAVVSLVDAQTQWGPRGSDERRAFEERLRARLDKQGSRRPFGVSPLTALGAFGSGILALVLVALVAPPENRGPFVEPQVPAGRSFLTTAYYDGDGSEDTGISDSQESYLPGEFQIWSEGLDVSDDSDVSDTSAS
jgi:hypothetical protein